VTGRLGYNRYMEGIICSHRREGLCRSSRGCIGPDGDTIERLGRAWVKMSLYSLGGRKVLLHIVPVNHHEIAI
jgi:hypothetical protein